MTTELTNCHPIEEAPRQRRARLTPQRTAVLGYLRSTAEHPDARTVYMHVRRVLPRISLGTVYRTLAFLRDAGLIQEFTEGPLARYDANLDAHDHAHCQRCGHIEDVAPAPLFGLAAVESRGFQVLSHHLAIQGICRTCRTGAGAS